MNVTAEPVPVAVAAHTSVTLGHTALVTTITGFVVSILVHAQPLISSIAGLAAIACSCYGIASYRKNLRARL